MTRLAAHASSFITHISELLYRVSEFLRHASSIVTHVSELLCRSAELLRHAPPILTHASEWLRVYSVFLRHVLRVRRQWESKRILTRTATLAYTQFLANYFGESLVIPRNAVRFIEFLANAADNTCGTSAIRGICCVAQVCKPGMRQHYFGEAGEAVSVSAFYPQLYSAAASPQLSDDAFNPATAVVIRSSSVRGSRHRKSPDACTSRRENIQNARDHA